jgi:queuine/archaeosine tRNA-ribosyltransferase
MTQESKNEKAVRIAENRLPRVRKGISLLSNLGNSQYELSEEQSNKIIRILKSDIAMLENKLLNRKSEVKSFNVKL